MNESKTMGFPIPLGGQDVAIGAGALSSTALIAGTQCVRLSPTVDCWVAVGKAPAAAAITGMFLAAGMSEYFTANEGWLVSVIQSATAGTLHVTPMYL
jgi:hypothetical protein